MLHVVAWKPLRRSNECVRLALMPLCSPEMKCLVLLNVGLFNRRPKVFERTDQKAKGVGLAVVRNVAIPKFCTYRMFAT